MYELYVANVRFGVEHCPRMDGFNKVLQRTVVGHVWVRACPRAEISQSDGYKNIQIKWRSTCRANKECQNFHSLFVKIICHLNLLFTFDR